MPERPHIIFLMADHLRHDVLGCTGVSRLFEGDPPPLSPNIDRLAARSLILDRHFTNCPLSVPARSSIMSGLYPHQHGAIINGWLPQERPFGTMRDDVELMPQHLLDAGYRVVHVGVQHVRIQPDFTQRLVGVEFVGPFGHGAHRAELQQRGLQLEDPALFKDPVIDFENGRPVVSSGTNAQVGIFPLVEDLFYDRQLAESMAATIRGHRSSQPLALFGMFWLPHPPLVVPRAWSRLVDLKRFNLPATTGKWYAGMPALQLANFPGQMGAHVTMTQWQQAWTAYLGMVALLDDCIGRVITALVETGIADDALIVITSDHGEMLGSHRLFQKMCMYEEAVRVPAIIKPPGRVGPRRSTSLTNHLDLTATLLDAAGAAPMPDSPGRSLLPLATGSSQDRPSASHVFASYDGNAGRAFRQRMARSRSHKLIHNIGDRPELYNLADDPRETRNLWNDPEHAADQRELIDALHAWMDATGDDQPRLKADPART